MSKKQVITQRGIAATLRESIFAPITPGPLKVIIDVGDIDYYIKRANELCESCFLEQSTMKSRLAAMTQAISLLAVAKILTRHNANPVGSHLVEGAGIGKYAHRERDPARLPQDESFERQQAERVLLPPEGSLEHDE